MPTKVNGPLMEDYTRALKAAKRFGAKSVRIEVGDGAITINLAEVDETAKPDEASPAPPRPRRGSWRAPNPRGEQAVDVVRDLLQNGPASLQQMRAALMRNGYSVATLGALLQTFKSDIERTGAGIYALKTAEPHDWKLKW
jgi:hypothetical protein